MSLHKGLAISICLSGILFLRAPAHGAAADSFRTLAGAEVRGEITKETIKGITINNKLVPKAEIDPDSLKYDSPPEAFTKAQEDLRKRDYPAAHKGFRAVIALAEAAGGAGEKGAKKKGAAPKSIGPAVRPIFHQHALWGEVETFRGEGNAAGAAAAVDDLLNTFPDSWYLPQALLLKVELAGSSAESVAAAKAIADKAGAGGDLSDRIELRQGKTLFDGGKKDEAEKIFRTLGKSGVKAVADESSVYLGLIQLGKGELVPAKMAFNSVLRTSKDRGILCGAARGLGEATLKEMGARKTPEGLREALESFLKAAVLYFPGTGDSAEAHQAALLSAGTCAEELMKMSTGSEKKAQRVQEGYRTVARDLYKEVIATYPKSEAANKANAALKRLSGPGQS